MCSKSKCALLILLFTLTGYSFPTFAQVDDALLASIRKAGEVKAALASNPPFQFISPSGKPAGSGVDLQNMVLKSMDLPELTPVFTEWNSMIPGLMARQFDFVGAGLNITEERCKAVIFSAPFWATQTGLFVQPGNPKRLTNVAEIAHRPDIKVSMPGGPYKEHALKQGINPSQIMLTPDVQAGIATVVGRRADVYIGGSLSITNPNEKGLELVIDEGAPVYASGIAFRKEDKQFRDAFNEQLVPLLRNGTLERLYEKYKIDGGSTLTKLLAKLDKASDIVPSCE
ncbi:ectoine/hydroxyectoine ABC transporter substrate-binding protein EhuB [Bradyrhizobium sp. CCBAU 51753]|uniref:ectoine/hydroxyectoine ABC transporter substrate-binding protein EhuB n=1 Tax=Bradyrhizobium sp. CCBAU 51753 TaxID=1325100 RepID=UPI00188CCAF7|nr:ectoine/hydroxyectoine ABC transporter substrate-binding protein EhuB [Bradyrhizobium sp. CCBAU 51753]QOZ23901.1 ectoine/hydroxyectoine ABC transporter substrate-binding protein EhuB [Bradyrhizobium sp. CCBAU 51753]